MYENKVGIAEVIGNSLAGLSFSGVTLLFMLLVAAAAWLAVPFVLLSMKRRLKALELSFEEQMTVVSADIRRVTDILLLQRLQSADPTQLARRGAGRADASADASDMEFASSPANEATSQPKFIAPRVIKGGAAPRRVVAG